MEYVGRRRILAALLAALTAGGAFWYCREKAVPAAAPARQPPAWIIDAGHGGEDGGAVSPSGAVESQINLAVARRLDGILGFLGERTLMLRQEDTSLHDPEAATLREKKVSDLHNRAAAAARYPEAVLVSIHQNIFQQARYRGTQVFYAPTEGSQALAQAIQAAVREGLQPDNSRESRPIQETVYLMNHVPNRAVLVECGFLSNPEEEGLLQDPAYQTKLALAIAAGCLRVYPYFNSRPRVGSDVIQSSSPHPGQGHVQIPGHCLSPSSIPPILREPRSACPEDRWGSLCFAEKRE